MSNIHRNRHFVLGRSLFLLALSIHYFQAKAAQLISWDAAWGVGTTPLPAQLQDMAMLRMLLYPPTSALAFLPAAYQQPLAESAAANNTGGQATSLRISNSSISTLCQTVAAYTMFLSTTWPTSLAVREP